MDQKEIVIRDEEGQSARQGELSYLFDSIETAVQERRLIREQALLGLSRYIAALLQEGSVACPPPKSFEIMSARMEDYLSFELDAETDCRRASSYSRVYQAIKLLEIARKDRQRDDQLQVDAVRFAQYELLLSVVARYPGITHKELAQRIGVSASALSQNAVKLEQPQYLLAQKVGSHKYYRLSYPGAALLKLIEARGTAAQRERQRQQINLRLKKIISEIYQGNVPEEFRDIEKYTKDKSLEQLKEILEEAEREHRSNPFDPFYTFRAPAPLQETPFLQATPFLQETPSLCQNENNIIAFPIKHCKERDLPEKNHDYSGTKRRMLTSFS